MAILSKDRISLHASAADKADAIRIAGELLVKSGCVLPEYVRGMLTREQSMSTSLGNGVAIPHGMDENRVHVLQTGISVLQLLTPVDWGDGDNVSLIIGIAATSDEHIGVLSNLAEAVDDESALSDLLTTANPDLVISYLGRENPSQD